MSSRLSAPRHSSLAYRPDIDGLRAIAVLLVVAFHAFPGVAPVGFIGVDVFFVISGYLISKIIIKDFDAGEFSYLSFYARRFRRIIPALLAMLLGIWVLGRFLLLASDFKDLGNHVLHGSLFVENFLLNKEAGYFAVVADLKPLLHIWSLAVEEQYYLVWPLILAWTLKRERWVASLIALMIVGSFALNIAQVSAHQSRVFYLLPTRFWELLLGGALACFERRRRLVVPEALGSALSLVATCLLLGMGFLLPRPQSYPGAWALIPTLAALVLIGVGPGAWVNRRVLSTRPAVFLGLVSYPWYLWHWPLLALLRLRYDVPGPALRAGAVALSLGLSWATWRLLELPVQRLWFPDLRDLRARRRCVGAALGALALTSALGLVTREGWILSPRQRSQEAYLDSYARGYYERNLVEAYRDDCNFYDVTHKAIRTEIAPQCVAPGKGPSILIWGDSHAQALGYGLSRYFSGKVAVMQVATSNCPPTLVQNREAPCSTSNVFALGRIKALKPDIVVIAQANEHEKAPWKDIVAELLNNGVRHVLIVGPVPQWGPDLYKIVAQDFGGVAPAYVATGLRSAILRTDAQMKELMRGLGGASYVSITDRLCDQRGCRASLGPDALTDLLTWDYGHLTTKGSDFVARQIVGPEIARLLRD